MYISRIKARNWRNFEELDTALAETIYLIGPNASGKSNFLDMFRFMRDIVNPKGGGLQQAVASRGGMAKLRYLGARRSPGIELTFELKEQATDPAPKWCYLLSFRYERHGNHRPMVQREAVIHQGETILERPNQEDQDDTERLTETHLELTNSNHNFREIAQFFQKILYLHLVPQLLRHGDMFVTKQMDSDPFGHGFLEQIAGTAEKSRTSRLQRIEVILKAVLPHSKGLRFVKDESTGRPHLEMRYVHWRPNAGWQREDQFSDGTLRLIALTWTLMSSDNVILLEEPELSLHSKIVEQIPRMVWQAHTSRKKRGGQVIISTHSPALLSDTSINGAFLVLVPGEKGESTRVEPPSDADIAAMQAGMPPADILLPRTSAAVGNL